MLTLICCKKEFVHEREPTSGKRTLKSLTTSACCEGIKTDCDGSILIFNDSAHFRDTYDCLEAEYEGWNDDFQSLYGSLSEDAYNAKADTLDFDEDATLLGFANCLNFTSMLGKLRAAEEVWLDTTVLDMNNDPEEDVPTDDEILLAMLSRYGEIIIGSVYYRYFPDSTIFEYPDYKCDNIETLRGNPSAHVESVNRITLGGVETDTCTAWKRNRDWYEYTDGKAYKYKVRIRNFLINSTVSTAMTSYKRKSNGRWRKWKANLYSELNGYIRDNACVQEGQITGNKSKKESPSQ